MRAKATEDANYQNGGFCLLKAFACCLLLDGKDTHEKADKTLDLIRFGEQAILGHFILLRKMN